MYSSLLRHALIVLSCFCAAPLVAQDVDPFGEIVKEPKKEKVIEDPFGGPPPKVKQDIDENPFVPAKQPANTQLVQPQHRLAVPTQSEKKQELEDPFAIQNSTQKGRHGRTIQPLKTEGAKEQDTSNESGDGILSDDRGVNTFEHQELPAEKTFEEKFWDYLKSNAYENWAPAPGQSAGPYAGQSPHGAFLKMYLNRTAIGDPEVLPNGSIIVKENYDVDRETLKAVTVMYRSKDYNPDGGDWYWIKYNPDGSVATTSAEMGAEKIMGRAQACIKCHADANDGDFAFFNDK